MVGKTTKKRTKSVKAVKKTVKKKSFKKATLKKVKKPMKKVAKKATKKLVKKKTTKKVAKKVAKKRITKKPKVAKTKKSVVKKPIIKKLKTKVIKSDVIKSDGGVKLEIFKLAKAVPEHKYFVLANGKPVKHVLELAEVLEDLEDHVFDHHVNPERNDFHNWVKDVFKDLELAKKMLKVSSKKDMQLVIYKHVANKVLK